MCVELRGQFVLYFALLCAVSVSGQQEPHPTVIVQPSANSIEVLKNSRLVLDCLNTSNIKNITVKWMKNGVQLQPQKRVYVALNGCLIIEKFLNKRRKSRDDTGFYECYATNSYGTIIGRQVEVKVARPMLRVEPENINVIAGGVARFQCHVESASPESSFCECQHLWHGNQANSMPSHFGILQLYNVSDTDGGKYTCRYHSRDVLEKSAFLSVHSGQLPGIPTLLNTPQNLSVISGRPAVLECLVEGGQNVKISWRYSNGSVVRQIRGKISFSGWLNLEFINTTSNDAGTYRCLVQHANGNFTRDYHLDVKVPPIFLVTPPEASAKVLAAITRLTCKATGNPKPTVQWYKNGLKLYPAPGAQINPELILYGRLEDSGYYQCIANNSLGINVATSWVDFKRQPNTPDIVTNVTATALSATEVNVTWSPATTPKVYPVMAYSIEYQIVHDLECPERCLFVAKRERDVSTPNYKVLKGLQPYTKYRFAVQCLSAKGASSMSEAVIVRTLETVPTSVPNVQIMADSSTSFRVSWTELSESERHGVISRYQLSYGTKDRMITVIQLPPDTRNYLVTGLEPNTEYVVKVLAGNSKGFPDIDNWVSHRTSVSSINGSSMPSLTFEPLNSSAVSIRWSNQDPDFIGSYRIVVQKLLESGPVREFNVSADVNQLDVTGLENKIFYKIDFMKRDEMNVVRAYVTELYQSVGTEGEMEPPPPYVLNPETRSSSVITLSWEKPKTRLNIAKYTVKFQQSEGDKLIDPPMLMNSFTTHVTLENLLPFTWYAVAVQSHTETADGPFCKPVIVQTEEGIPSPPEILLAEVVSPGTVKLKWGPPKQQNGIITYYIIYYNPNKDVADEAWSSIHQNASHTSVVLEDLKSEVYYFKLRACTNAGAGRTSRVIMIDTLDCNSCPKCKDSESCLGEADESKRNVFEQRLGILIGCAVGFICIVICITFVVFKQREMNNRTRTELAWRFNPTEQTGRFLGNADTARLHQHSTYSPMLRRMLENTDYTYKAGNEQHALLSPGSTGSVNNQTSTSNTESCDTTPCSSDYDIVYHRIKNCESVETGLVLGEGREKEMIDSNHSFSNCRVGGVEPQDAEPDTLNA